MTAFARRVIHYQRSQGRHNLPWQRPLDLYRIWVSEIMLQQTQVATVIPYFRAFVKAFPSVKRLAAAPQDAVLEHWAGLGYYARARHLHQAARDIWAAGGRFPRTVDGWMSLPGVGRSTAGTIVSLGLDIPAPMLDGNARRVIARHQGLAQTANAALWQATEKLLPRTRAGAYTQGLMDLGAQCCTVRDPDCAHCPLRRDCAYVASGAVGKSARRPTVKRSTRWLVIVAQPNGQVLLQRRPPRGIWGGLWSVPEFSSQAAARHWIKGQGLAAGKRGPRCVHRLSHRELHLYPLRVQLDARPQATLDGQGQWFDPARPGVGVATPIAQLIS